MNSRSAISETRGDELVDQTLRRAGEARVVRAEPCDRSLQPLAQRPVVHAVIRRRDHAIEVLGQLGIVAPDRSMQVPRALDDLGRRHGPTMPYKRAPDAGRASRPGTLTRRG